MLAIYLDQNLAWYGRVYLSYCEKHNQHANARRSGAYLLGNFHLEIEIGGIACDYVESNVS